MPEIVSIALLNFVLLAIGVALLYVLCRLIRFTIALLPEGLSRSDENDTWDQVGLLYRVPGSIFGFLILDYLVIGLVSSFVAEGIEDIMWGGLCGIWWVFTEGMGNLTGIIGCAGIFAASVFGIYQDHPPTRLKTLAVIAGFSALVGFGFRLH